MNQPPPKFLDELAKLMTNAAGAAQGVRQEIDNVIRTQAERILNDLDVVNREEFDVVRDMAMLARQENVALNARIAALEAEIAALKAAKTRTTKKPSSTKKTKAK